MAPFKFAHEFPFCALRTVGIYCAVTQHPLLFVSVRTDFMHDHFDKQSRKSCTSRLPPHLSRIPSALIYMYVMNGAIIRLGFCLHRITLVHAVEPSETDKVSVQQL